MEIVALIAKFGRKKADEKGLLFVGRDIIGGPIRIENY